MAKRPKPKKNNAPTPPKGRGPFKPLFLTALALAAALAGACGWLALQRQAGLDMLADLERELADQRNTVNLQQQELDRRQAELDEAEETIGLLARYTLVTPEGEPPE